MAISSGNLIDDADIASRFYSVSLAPVTNSSGTHNLSTNGGYIFYCYSNTANTHKGFGIAYYIDSSSGWSCRDMASSAGGSGSITVAVSSAGQVQVTNTTTTTAHFFMIWTPANC